ncbi:MAG: TolC family protein [Desulfobacterales bacterium]|nr:TolC family protein [Deltaproteobacteria bacterium]NNL41684.1 TolC family protein [Desulfobacterales bacterium]NNL78147.1 TolC family protein [Desulfobacterales bacterium]
MIPAFKIILVLLILSNPARAASGTETKAETKPAESAVENQIQITLDQAINLALGANRNIIFSANTVTSSELSLEAAESEFAVKFVPTVGASVSLTGSASDTAESLSAGAVVEKKIALGPKGSIGPRVVRSDSGQYTTGIGVSLNIPLFRGFGREYNLNRVDATSHSLRNVRRSYYLQRDRTVVDTVSAIYGIVKQENLERLYRTQVEMYQGHEKTATIKEKAGLASSIDVYRAKISIKDAEDNLSRTQKSLADAKDRLKLILAIPLSWVIQVTAPDEYDPVTLREEQALDIALANRVELKQAEDSMDEAIRKSKIAKHNLWPDLNLFMDYERAGTADDFSQSTDFEENIWRVSLTGGSSWPKTAEKTAFSQSLISVKTERLKLELKRDEIQREVRAQLEVLKKAENSIKIRQEQIKTAEGKLELAKIKFRHEMADNFDVIESETELENAKVNLLSARTEYIVGTYKMRSVLGTLIQ